MLLLPAKHNLHSWRRFLTINKHKTNPTKSLNLDERSRKQEYNAQYEDKRCDCFIGNEKERKYIMIMK